MRIALFVTCLADAVFPDVGRATVAVLERLGHQVEFPAAQAAAVAVSSAAPAPASVDRPGRLLVVDDEEAIADLVRDVLEPQGWSVRTARDGSEALGIVASEEFDVLLVDMRMPGMIRFNATRIMDEAGEDITELEEELKNMVIPPVDCIG